MKNILLFRSANYTVIDLLIGSLNLNDNIYCLIQKDSEAFFSEKYPTITTIPITQNYFDYLDFYQNVTLPVIFYDSVYVPISGKNYSSLNEILDIIDDLNYGELILFDFEGNKKIIPKNTTPAQNNKFLDFIMLFHYKVFSFQYIIKQKIDYFTLKKQVH